MTLGEEGRRTGRRDCFDRICDKNDVILLRKADLGEQELYYKHYPKWSLKDAEDGEPVFWNSPSAGNLWVLGYADGNGSLYFNGMKSGRTWTTEHVLKFDPNNLPVNN